MVQRLKEIDEKNCRPLYLLLLTDALVTGDIENIHNEDGLLNYAFVRERNIIRSRIKAAFGVSIKHHRKLYEEIEVSYADAVVSRAGGISQGIADMSKECGISKEHYSNLCEEYGLTVNNNIPVIEPDLLAEYYVMRYADKFCHLWGIQEFWVPFFRDFNKKLYQ